MRTLLWALVVVALEVLLISGYDVWLISGHSGVLEMGYLASTNEALLALLVGTVSVVVWLGFGRTLRRIVLAVVGRVLFNPESRDVRD
jgi:hypothetical protein